jgi:hypothetical protein
MGNAKWTKLRAEITDASTRAHKAVIELWGAVERGDVNDGIALIAREDVKRLCNLVSKLPAELND